MGRAYHQMPSLKPGRACTLSLESTGRADGLALHTAQAAKPGADIQHTPRQPDTVVTGISAFKGEVPVQPCAMLLELEDKHLQAPCIWVQTPGLIAAGRIAQMECPLLSFIQLNTSFNPESLRLALTADSDPEIVLSNLDMP